MKRNIRCPACGRRRKESHEARVGKEGTVCKTKDGTEIRRGAAYSKDCLTYGDWQKKNEKKEAKAVGDLCHES